ncbi:MAG TPA: hypothetical protein VEL74_02190 [Thermoanaerobaculia bacterium]|nr:hypothetical protein [Thermoanaerobaculia bacterium]
MLDPQARFTLPGLPGVLIFPDDHLAGGFYALPEVPRVALDGGGAPQISLMLYGRKGAGGAFEATGGILSLTTTLELTPEEDEAIRSEMARRLAAQDPPVPGRPQKLSPEWIDTEVTVHLIPGFDLKGKPSMTGGNLCSFQHKLTADQAKELQKAWNDGLKDASATYRATVRAAPRAGSSFEIRSAACAMQDEKGSNSSASLHVQSAVTQAAPLPLTLEGPLRAEGLQERLSTVGL